MAVFQEDSQNQINDPNVIFSDTGLPTGVTTLTITQFPSNGRAFIDRVGNGSSRTQIPTDQVFQTVVQPFEQISVTFEPDTDFAGFAGVLSGNFDNSFFSGVDTSFSETVLIQGTVDDPDSLSIIPSALGTIIPEEAPGGAYFDARFIQSPADDLELWFVELTGTDPDITFAAGHNFTDFLTFTILDPVTPFEIITLDQGTGTPTDDRHFLLLKADATLDFETQTTVSVTIRVDDNQPGATSGILDRTFTFDVGDRAEVIDEASADSPLIAYDTASAGNDVIYGGDGADVVFSGRGSDVVFGGNGIDVILGGADPDLLVGQGDADAIAGEGGNDTIAGEDGDDLLDGGEGDDSIFGGPDNDRLFGAAGQDTLFGNAGNDTLNGNAGADQMEGGEGDDTHFVDDLNDTVVELFGQGYDRIISDVSILLPDHVEAGSLRGDQDLIMIAASTGSWIVGNSGDNILVGQDANDRLDGSAGDDTLDGGNGNDVMQGGSGTDTFALSAGIDVFLDFEDGTDVIDMTDLSLSFADLSIRQLGSDLLLSHVFGSLTLRDMDLADLSADDFNEPVASSPPVANGTEVSETLSFASGPLEVRGLGGNDTLLVLEGAATLVGGTGDDRYYLYQDGTIVTELADEGYDRVYTQVDVTLAENVEFGAANGAGNVDLTGNALANELSGNADSNVLEGLAGADRLRGREGDDTLVGGTDNDVLEGGLGVDHFVFLSGDGIDVVLDFQLGVDVLDYSGTALVFEELAITDGAVGALVRSGDDVVVIRDVLASELDQDQFIFSI